LAGSVIHFDLKLADLRVLTNYGFDHGGIDIVAANENQIVRSSQDAANQPPPGSATGTGPRIDANSIAGPIPDQRAAHASEISYD
jgi:hypothetical protein